jgi:hypothetical protein
MIEKNKKITERSQFRADFGQKITKQSQKIPGIKPIGSEFRLHPA